MTETNEQQTNHETAIKMDSPLGPLRLVSNGSGLTAIEFPGRHRPTADQCEGSDAVLRQARQQLQEYFSGTRREFELPLAATGTAFQQRVWQALTDIPYGELRSYSDLARHIGKPQAVRAVGAANGRNPLPIVVPCHRVIGSDGSLTGFAGGLAAKQLLLEMEGAIPTQQQL
jgi:methylated-DNA-[protein]-cysteine S-methyltransferase